ncbi:hypothetical protein S83_063150, partial [Arachis hypogaea]
VDMLQKGFKVIGQLKNGRSSSYHKLNPTSTVHYLGMDIHDCSMVSFDAPLKPGVIIFTLKESHPGDNYELGVYIPSSYNCPERGLEVQIR